LFPEPLKVETPETVPFSCESVPVTSTVPKLAIPKFTILTKVETPATDRLLSSAVPAVC